MFSFHPYDVFWIIAHGCGGRHCLSLCLDNSVERGINAPTWSPHLLYGKFTDHFEGPRGTLLKVHSMDALVHIGGIFSGHHLLDDRMALFLATLLCGSHSTGPPTFYLSLLSSPASLLEGVRPWALSR